MSASVITIDCIDITFTPLAGVTCSVSMPEKVVHLHPVDDPLSVSASIGAPSSTLTMSEAPSLKLHMSPKDYMDAVNSWQALARTTSTINRKLRFVRF